MKKILIVDVPEGNENEKISIVYAVSGYHLDFTEFTPPSDGEIIKDMMFDDDIPDDCFIPDAVTGANWFKSLLQ